MTSEQQALNHALNVLNTLFMEHRAMGYPVSQADAGSTLHIGLLQGMHSLPVRLHAEVRNGMLTVEIAQEGTAPTVVALNADGLQENTVTGAVRMALSSMMKR